MTFDDKTRAFMDSHYPYAILAAAAFAVYLNVVFVYFFNVSDKIKKSLKA